MIYLDHGATSMGKPPQVGHAMVRALQVCGNPGRGGHAAAMAGAEVVYSCREEAAKLFACRPEQVAFTASCTHGLNIAIRTLVRPGGRVVISGFEHNAVVRPLHALGAQVVVAGKRLFDSDDLVAAFEKALPGADAAVFTHVSNVFGFILPVERLAELCAQASLAGLEPKRLRLVRHRPDKSISLILLACRKGAKPGLSWDELCLFDADGQPTVQYKTIYHL